MNLHSANTCSSKVGTVKVLWSAEVPHKATMLNAVEIPAHGGNTLFASGYAAYDTLPDELREPLEGRKAFHHYNYGSVQKGDDKGTPAFAESVHPVFRTHDDTGKKAIYVNRLMTEGVVDMEQSRMAGWRSAAVGQPLFDARTHGFSGN
ncbi:MAG: hypothetical protein EBU57_03995 [Alphaproteobacteria bacterium]|nr:hypothetical protein [Alphaproteobacteria bacterium]